MLTQQQQLLLTTDKSTPTTITKEELIIIPITSVTTTLARNFVITPNGNCKRITIGKLVKTWISWLTTMPINTLTTTLNKIIANITIAVLTNDLRMIYLTIMEWNHVNKAHG